MSLAPYWLYPIEPMSAEAIEAACDADRRNSDTLVDTLIVRLR